ncbi:hypothetical protein F0260_17005 [Vibrio coralliilyticus]|nr:hypothetical protein [Vibrio coralliilyticus]
MPCAAHAIFPASITMVYPNSKMFRVRQSILTKSGWQQSTTITTVSHGANLTVLLLRDTHCMRGFDALDGR